MHSFDEFLDNLKAAIHEIIPIKLTFENEGLEYRFIDNLRPMIQKEEKFFKYMKLNEYDLVKKYQRTSFNFKTVLPADKVYIALSVPYDELGLHLKKMINSQCHLLWIDCISINQVNYFNLIWQNNQTVNGVAFVKPPAYLIFYDLNTAQLAQIYHEYSNENKWNLELVESYIKVKSIEPKIKFTRKSKLNDGKSPEKIPFQNPATIKSNEEIFYFCQFRQLFITTNENVNKLQHSIIDTRFNDSFDQCVQYSSVNRSISVPFRICPLVVNVNTITNKHYYYTCLYKPIDIHIQNADKEYSVQHTNHLKVSEFYYCSKNLNDNELIELFESNSKNSWKLIDLKAYKDEKSITKFSAVWSSIKGFYEGTFKLYIGLTRDETLSKINELNSKGLWPRIVTSYSYLDNSGEHVYAIFFCQF